MDLWSNRSGTRGAGGAGRRRGRQLGAAASALALHGAFLALLTSGPLARAEAEALGASDLSQPGGALRAVTVSLARLEPGGLPAASPPEPAAPDLKIKPDERTAPPSPTAAPSPPPADLAGPALPPRAAAAPELAEAAPLPQFGGMKGCDIAGVLQAQLQLDPSVGTAVSGWPEAVRPMVGARVLWDGRWVDTDMLGGGDTLEPIRRLISAVALTAPSDCLGSEILGPLAFSAPVGGRLAGKAQGRSLWFTLGSDRWRWGDLLDAAPQEARRTVATIPPSQELTP